MRLRRSSATWVAIPTAMAPVNAAIRGERSVPQCRPYRPPRIRWSTVRDSRTCAGGGLEQFRSAAARSVTVPCRVNRSSVRVFPAAFRRYRPARKRPGRRRLLKRWHGRAGFPKDPRAPGWSRAGSLTPIEIIWVSVRVDACAVSPSFSASPSRTGCTALISGWVASRNWAKRKNPRTEKVLAVDWILLDEAVAHQRQKEPAGRRFVETGKAREFAQSDFRPVDRKELQEAHRLVDGFQRGGPFGPFRENFAWRPCMWPTKMLTESESLCNNYLNCW